MTVFKLIKDDEVLINLIETAFSLGARMRGLLGRKMLGHGVALYIKPCGSIHTFWMKFLLDVIFLDRDMRVVCINRDIPPFRMVIGGKHAASVIELESGWFDWGKLNVGDMVNIINNE